MHPTFSINLTKDTKSVNVAVRIKSLIYLLSSLYCFHVATKVIFVSFLDILWKQNNYSGMAHYLFSVPIIHKIIKRSHPSKHRENVHRSRAKN